MDFFFSTFLEYPWPGITGNSTEVRLAITDPDGLVKRLKRLTFPPAICKSVVSYPWQHLIPMFMKSWLQSYRSSLFRPFNGISFKLKPKSLLASKILHDVSLHTGPLSSSPRGPVHSSPGTLVSSLLFEHTRQVPASRPLYMLSSLFHIMYLLGCAGS